MGKKTKETESIAEPLAELSKKSASTVRAHSAAFDPALASLFATSSGPVRGPPIQSPLHRHASEQPQQDRTRVQNDVKARPANGVSRSRSLSPEPSTDNVSTSSAGSGSDEEEYLLPSRKRRCIAAIDDIEGAYMKRLVDQELRTPSTLQHNGHPPSPSHAEAGPVKSLPEQVASQSPEEEYEKQVPQHESLGGSLEANESDKADRTVFLGNVSVEAIKSKSARKLLLSHLSSCLSTLQSRDTPHKVESLRFRSTAFASGVGPKRAAYAKKELMEETSHSTHAYVVYTTKAAAERAATSLNGTIVLDRHLRTDLVACPAEIDHRRCVFVGNLGFVDEETVETATKSGGTERKQRAKQPADTEEGLWRTFSKAGRIESVRVVRDRSTRVGKGIAYVQFHDENGVEAALLYNDIKFPPLLPRKLRVTRARKPKKITNLQPRLKEKSAQKNKPSEAKNSRNDRLVERDGRSNKAKAFVFEGHRATKPSISTGKTPSKKRKSVKPTTRSSRRGAAYKAAGGKPEKS